MITPPTDIIINRIPTPGSLIATAFVKAQKEFGPAIKSSINPFFKTKYADLSACIEAVIDALNNNGIALMQKTHECANGVTVETILIHESGEQISGGTLHVPACKQDPQAYGSALTYARRYSLSAACGIAPEDDDGNAASKSQQPDGSLDELPKDLEQLLRSECKAIKGLVDERKRDDRCNDLFRVINSDKRLSKKCSEETVRKISDFYFNLPKIEETTNDIE